MEQPLHTLRTAPPSIFSPQRLAALGASTVIVFAFAWALSVGLAQTLVEKGLEELKAEVIPEKLPDKTPPPPPPDLKEPPPPFVPPPDFVIQTDAPVTNTITVQSHVATPPPLTAPASYGKKHNCDEYYPAISNRLGETGVVVVGFMITADGSVTDPKIQSSSGSERLDNAVLTCVVNKWHYTPAKNAAGQPVATPWKAEVRFVLQNH